MSHYYTNDQNLPSKEVSFEYFYEGERFVFYTDYGVFSKTQVDYGTYLLINEVRKHSLGSSVLDLGCGYGVIGIILSRLSPTISNMVMVDVNKRALSLAKKNCDTNKVKAKIVLSDDIRTLKDKFTSVILNPPIRAGKQVIFALYQKARDVLDDGGSLFIVIQKKHGAASTEKELKNLFNEVRVLDKVNGHWLFEARK